MKLNLKWQHRAVQTLLKKVQELFLCSCAGGGAGREGWRRGWVRSEQPEVRPLQVLPRWTNKSNAAPCLTWPTVHRAACVNKIMGLIPAGLSAGSRQRNSEESLLLSLLLLLRLALSLSSGTWRAGLVFFACVTGLGWTLTSFWRSSCVSFWPDTRGKFCSGMSWWTKRRRLPSPSWWLRKSEGGRRRRGPGRSPPAHP